VGITTHINNKTLVNDGLAKKIVQTFDKDNYRARLFEAVILQKAGLDINKTKFKRTEEEEKLFQETKQAIVDDKESL